MKQYQKNQRGITLLITLLLMGVLLGISASLLNLTLKQYQLAGIALSSETAFQAANAGLECILYYDFLEPSPFEVPVDGSEQLSQPSVSCMGGGSVLAENSPNETSDTDNDGRASSGVEQRFRFDWGNVCSEVSIYKFSTTDPGGALVTVGGRNMRQDLDSDGTGDPCPAGSVCTVVQARGYNVPCDDIGSNPRVVEREYTQVY